jgi:hypothetical protein
MFFYELLDKLQVGNYPSEQKKIFSERMLTS